MKNYMYSEGQFHCGGEGYEWKRKLNVNMSGRLLSLNIIKVMLSFGVKSVERRRK